MPGPTGVTTAVRPVIAGLLASPQAGFVARSVQVGGGGPAHAVVGTAMAADNSAALSTLTRTSIMNLLVGLQKRDVVFARVAASSSLYRHSSCGCALRAVASARRLLGSR